MPGRTLDGKVTPITGARRGIGREIALAMTAHGATIMVNDIGGWANSRVEVQDT